jgi:four helix bundle protein
MTAKSFSDLICWQLSVELRRGVLAFTAKSAVRQDLDYCRQIRKSSRSPSANIAEGFGRSDAIFRRHLDIALGSLQETANHLHDALDEGYLTPTEHERMFCLTKRAWVAADRLKRYLTP